MNPFTIPEVIKHSVLRSANAFSDQELRDWIKALSPAKGIYVRFQGFSLLDHDLKELLEFKLRDKQPKNGRRSNRINANNSFSG